MEYINWVISFALGIVVGVVFSILKLPVPGPSTVSSILAVIGFFLGDILMNFLIGT